MNAYIVVLLIQYNNDFAVTKTSRDYIKLSIDPKANTQYTAIARAVINAYIGILGLTPPRYENLQKLNIDSRRFVGEEYIDDYNRIQVAVASQLSNLDSIITYHMSKECNDPIHFGQYWRDVTNLLDHS